LINGFHFSETLLSLNGGKEMRYRKITFYKNYFQDFFVLANGFQKKSQKTPFSEIQLALKIKREYENEK
jgi:phage-related protein